MADFQDLSGLPVDDTMAQMELQRRLKMAQALQESKMPEGQMIGGHFVAPSFTQQLANVYSKYLGGQKEREAMQQFGEYNKAKQSKLSEAFDTYIKGKEPIAETQSTDNYVSKPYDIGANIPTSMFKTTEQLAQTSPSFNTQNMPEQMVNQPITSTTYRQPTRTEQLANITNFLKKSGNTDMLNKVVLGEAENLFKTPESVLGKVDLDKFDPQSINNFILSGSKDYSLLKPIVKADRTNLSNVGKLTSELNDIIVANPRDPRIPQYRNAIQKETTYKDESNKPPAGYAWGKPDVNGIATLVPYKGGPGDKAANPTKEQSDAYTFSTRMENADKTLNELEGQYNPLIISAKTSPITSNIPGAQSAINYKMSENDQRAEQAQRDFVNAVLRRESGSAISQAEFDNARIQYFPQPNDKPGQLKQKAENRRAVIQGLKQAAGSMVNQSQGKVVDFNSMKD